MTRYLKFYADSGDLTILIISSEKSSIMVNGAAHQAKKMCLPLIGLSGFSLENPLKKFRDVIFWADCQEYNIIEMTHHVWLLAIVEYIIKQKKINQWKSSLLEEQASLAAIWSKS